MTSKELIENVSTDRINAVIADIDKAWKSNAPLNTLTASDAIRYLMMLDMIIKGE